MRRRMRAGEGASVRLVHLQCNGALAGESRPVTVNDMSYAEVPSRFVLFYRDLFVDGEDSFGAYADEYDVGERITFPLDVLDIASVLWLVAEAIVSRMKRGRLDDDDEILSVLDERHDESLFLARAFVKRDF